MDKVHLFLHIGLPKTGSTAIQQLLAANGRLLAQHALLYPSAGRLGNAHHKLAWSLNPGHPRYPEFSLLAHQFWESLAKEIAVAEASKVILSSEAFPNIKQLDLLRKYTEPYHTEVIVYLRRQDHRLQSGYQQHIKGYGRFQDSIQEYIQARMISGKDDYAKRLEQWRKLYGKGSLIVKAYEKEQLPRGLLADFLENVGLNLTQQFVTPARPNISLSRDAVEFLRLCNAYPIDEEHRIQLVRTLKDFSSRQENRQYFDTHSWISPRARIKILQHHETSNSYVAREYLGRADGKLFYEPWPDPSMPWQPYPGLSVEQATKFFIEAYAAL